MIEVSIKEIERYLGYRGLTEVDDHVRKLIDECINDMNKQVIPKYTYKVFPIEWNTDNTSSGDIACSFAGINVGNGNLVKNIKACQEIVMMAVTLGPGPDMLLRKYEVRDMLKAYVCQAVGAAMVEAWCDEVNDKIVDEIKARGLYARPRFSPGYGDFPLLVQKDFERILNMPKLIGVSVSDSLLMTPTKSITAVIGISDKSVNCVKNGCESCNMADKCEYSRK
ncbi:MAG: Vitamin B12 dependent methionine synthase activation subunit [Eubacterium sp.]|nr:Vitamin B12 dependent methionine synthase activation subunit [Eubacterium sp.]